MSAIDSAKSAISKSNMDSLRTSLTKLSKEEIQELASNYHAVSAIIFMRGSWVEESTGNLIDLDRKIIQKNVVFERGFRGDIQQYYGLDSLHKAALTAIEQNVTIDFDSDYFTSGSMIFGEESGLGADDANYNADINFEERYIRNDEIPDDVDQDECELDDSDGDIKLRSALIQAIEIEIELDNKNKILLPLLEAEPKEQWFIFSILFMSSKKTVDELDGNEYLISEFMESCFDISI